MSFVEIPKLLVLRRPRVLLEAARSSSVGPPKAWERICFTKLLLSSVTAARVRMGGM